MSPLVASRYLSENTEGTETVSPLVASRYLSENTAGSETMSPLGHHGIYQKILQGLKMCPHLWHHGIYQKILKGLKLCPHLWHHEWDSQRRDNTFLYNPNCFEKTVTVWKDKGDNSIKSGCQCIVRDFASYQFHINYTSLAQYFTTQYVKLCTGIHRCKFNWMGWVFLFYEKSKEFQVYFYKLRSLYIGMRREVGRMFSLVWKSVKS